MSCAYAGCIKSLKSVLHALAWSTSHCMTFCDVIIDEEFSRTPKRLFKIHSITLSCVLHIKLLHGAVSLFDAGKFSFTTEWPGHNFYLISAGTQFLHCTSFRTFSTEVITSNYYYFESYQLDFNGLIIWHFRKLQLEITDFEKKQTYQSNFEPLNSLTCEHLMTFRIYNSSVARFNLTDCVDRSICARVPSHRC